MNKQSIFYAIAAVILAAYIVAAGIWTSKKADDQMCMGLEGNTVTVITDRDKDDPGFVTPAEMTRQLGSIAQTMSTMRLSDIDIDSISQKLNALDKLEYAIVNRLANNQIRVKVRPMEPVARIWDPNGRNSFYINRSGKHMSADARFTIDVPQVTGKFSADFKPERLLPLFDWLNDHPEWNKIITMVTVRDSADIILIPAMRGHVINFGHISSIPNKFARLKRFYSDVMPVKGWEYYDTLSVKWDGQIVATRRKNKLPATSLEIIEELENEGDTQDTMDTGSDDTTSNN